MKKSKYTKHTIKTLTQFYNAYIRLLKAGPAEEINISNLCIECGCPRSTFYNYFEDLDDLIDFILEGLLTKVPIDDYKDVPADRRTMFIFENVYKSLEAVRPEIEPILKNNSPEGSFQRRLATFMKKKINEIIITCGDEERYGIDYNIVSDHYANTFGLLLEKCFIISKGNRLSFEEAKYFVDKLLLSFEREIEKGTGDKL